ncbi:MAG: phosphatase PAP2 family protein [bacterium]|nr:phosphatase PAP2 family protein [bacterium]
MENTNLFFQIFNLSHQNPLLDQLMVFGAEYLIFISYLLALLLFFKAGSSERKALVLTVLGFLISQILIRVIHLFYLEPRPFITFPITPLIKHTAEASFPSTHTTIMATLAFSYMIYHSKYTLLFIFFLVWVGFARIFVGVHYPFDILGGMAVGLFSIRLAWILKNFLQKKISRL